MEQIVLVVHLLVAISIIGLIMLQQGKGADMGASFGAGASQTLLGSDGSGNILTRSTAWLVVLFFATSFGLAIIANGKSAAVNDLDLDIPAVVLEGAAIEQVEIGSELPVIETEVPEASSATTEQDVPDL
ncbi:MAG: preprotein translocase subunit SecG [Proteobacteria bacterium]|nr:preprotein translocase subunit SecG [Pseudomonadota bacterium]